MGELFEHGTALSAFLAASFALCVTPGPGVVYIVTRSVSQGRRAGLASVVGVALGNLANAILASVGLAAVFAVSSLAYEVVKYAGAAYLLWLGLGLVFGRTRAATATESAPPLSRAFRDGLFVAILNPKTALFFAAFVPQFVTPGGPVIVQSLALSVTFVCMAAVTDSAYAMSAGTASRLLPKSSSAVGRRVAGGVYIALAIAAVARGSRSAA